jgi:hypothetical protein
LKIATKRSQYGTLTNDIEPPFQDLASSDDEDYDAQPQPQFETDEGLSLLWNQRHQDLDNALHQRKDEDIYVHPWYHYFACCSCWPTTSSA